jgi:tetratricopeptide (TPR) repeat protein
MRRYLTVPLLAVIVAACGPKAPVIDAPAADVPAEQQQGLSADARIIEAMEHVEAGELDVAAKWLDELVANEPDHALARLNQGVVRFKMNDMPGAIDSFDALTRMTPEDPQAWLYLGVAREKSGQLSQALDVYRAGIAQAPEDMDLRVAAVGVLRKLGRLDDAQSEARAALQVNANSLGVYNNLGLAYIDSGEFELAQFVFQKALSSITDAAPRDLAYINANLGWTFYEDGDAPTAALYLDKALALDAELIPALIYRARIYQDNRQYEQMVPLLEAARTLDPENGGALLNLGIAYRGTGNLDKAEALYKELADGPLAKTDALFNLGILLGDDRKSYEAAVETLNRYIEAGGAEQERALEYVAAFEKERSRAERKRAKDEEAETRKQEMEERKKLLEEAESAAPAEPPPAEPPAVEAPPAEVPPAAPPAGEPSEQPPGETEPPPADDASPWG